MDTQVRRALISVYDKEGVVEFCRRLVALDIELVSSGGTARVLAENDIPVMRVPELTGYPEMLGGRVKTLHPAIHGGILAIRDDPSHMQDLEKSDLKPIDLVVVNLYPFEQTAARPDATLPEVVEMIDIGGPAMLRSAAKNHGCVAVVVSPSDYSDVADQLEKNRSISLENRRRLALSAFRHTAEYDRAIVNYLETAFEEKTAGDSMHLSLERVSDLRYGENPHQQAAFYRDPLETGVSLSNARQLKGKPLSFNNILDLDAAMAIVGELPQAGCAILKHGNPCGVAMGDNVQAFDEALASDPVSAFGGVIAFNSTVDADVTARIAKGFYEGLLAPSFTEAAIEALRKKKNLRILEVGSLDNFERSGRDYRRVSGGLLVQEWDPRPASIRDGKVVTKRAPTEDEWNALEFGWVVAKHVKSNAIVYSDHRRTLGIGAGQMSRVDSAKFGALKAQSSLRGCAMASDAFFPFRDGIDAAAENGVLAIVQPGGSIRDEEVIAAADEHGMTMVFTGERHFRH